MVGQFKDDQLQDHKHFVYTYQGGNDGTAYVKGSAGSGVGGFTSYSDASTMTGRFGDTTHGKQKAVFIYIKATSGLSENAQDNVINTLNEQRSYSTEEHLTGRKWINGKPIYRRVVTSWLPYDGAYNVASWNIDTMVDLRGFIVQNNGNIIPIPYNIGNGDSLMIYLKDTKDYLVGIIYGGYATTAPTVIVEYTKTTDV